MQDEDLQPEAIVLYFFLKSSLQNIYVGTYISDRVGMSEGNEHQFEVAWLAYILPMYTHWAQDYEHTHTRS